VEGYTRISSRECSERPERVLSIFKLLRRSGIDSEELIPPAYVAGGLCWNFRIIYGGYDPSGIGVLYRPAGLSRLAKSSPWNRYLGSLKVLKIPSLVRQPHSYSVLSPTDCFKIPAPRGLAPDDCWIWGEWGLKEYKWKGSFLGWFVVLFVPVEPTWWAI
jgi:hypothetical protein